MTASLGQKQQISQSDCGSVKKHPLANCSECDLRDAPYVPASGPPGASMAFVGEAPGLEEADAGAPFVGLSGLLLNEVLAGVGIERSGLHLTNVVSCLPPRDKNDKQEAPTKNAIACCSKRLAAELQGKETIVTLGGVASSAVMGEKVGITKFRTGPPKTSPLYPQARVIPTFHPAACLRSGDHFPSMVADFEKILAPPLPEWIAPEYKVFNPHTAVGAIKQLMKYDELVIDIETAYGKDGTYVQANHYELLCIGICYAPGKVAVIDRAACAAKRVWYWLKQLLERKKLIAHNGKFDLSGLAGIGRGRLYFDTMLASYALDERGGIHGLKYIAAERFGVGDYAAALKPFTSKGGNYADVPPSLLHKYVAYDCSITYDLYRLYDRELEEAGVRHLHDRLVRLSNIFLEIEMEGMKIDQSVLAEVDVELSDKLFNLEVQLLPWVKNPRSPQQVKASLLEMGIDVESTDKEHLEALVDDGYAEEFVTLLLEYRKYHKLHTTYVKGLQSRLFDGRIHSTFMLHGTTTGRPASRNPNLLNIPRGSSIRKLFVPARGNILIQGDFSQVEYRVVACLAQEPFLKEIFDDPNRDVFGELAFQMFGAGWQKHHRQIVKRVVHGTNYGMKHHKMADQINKDASDFGVEFKIKPFDAERFQWTYLNTIPQVRKWQKETENEITESDKQALDTPFGRQRKFWLITRQNKHKVVNEGLAFRPQSIASDICMDALETLHRELPQEARLRLTVYDSIMVECPIPMKDEVSHLMEKCMVEAAQSFSDYTRFATDIQTSTESWGALV